MAPNRYNRFVHFNRLHDWNLTTSQARDLQNRLSLNVCRLGNVVEPHFIAGIDVSSPLRARGMGTAAVVLLEYPGLELVETQTIRGQIDFPYVPGLLSFREAPLILQAFEKLTHAPDLIIVDGQGIAHPRRLGIAAHLGLFFDIPTIGCAKTRLCGTYKEPALAAGNFEELVDNGESIGVVLRTKNNVKPLFISIGNNIAIEDAVFWVMRCCRGYRLPEPIRFAHQVAGSSLKSVVKT